MEVGVVVGVLKNSSEISTFTKHAEYMKQAMEARGSKPMTSGKVSAVPLRCFMA
ncbi:hypothetical protein AXF42_Ash000543 [Apostasia shenzhenica]|uniref:Uncharacterized protein n=1 Tax=Apostasia shenzhenica TaxID=1088818 RepID=A0A2I0AGP7_9ASPA|nr:hypothetical protein AXF42_Ash000543 [Apostasia shenzhenica]